MLRIYVASSWRNDEQQHVVAFLREIQNGMVEVYDFKNPRGGDKGFHWSEIDPEWGSWNKHQYREHLADPIAVNGYQSDYDAMQWADVFVGVMPFGRSASMEMGWAAGNGKKTILLLADGEPELMVKMFDHIVCDYAELAYAVSECPGQRPDTSQEWTTETPAKSGLYWYALSEKAIMEAQIVKVSIGEIGLGPDSMVSIMGTGQQFHLETMNGVWMGPVEVPGRD